MCVCCLRFTPTAAVRDLLRDSRRRLSSAGASLATRHSLSIGALCAVCVCVCVVLCVQIQSAIWAFLFRTSNSELLILEKV